MNLESVLDCVTVFFAGLLAGALFVIDYGVRAPVAALAEQSQIGLVLGRRSRRLRSS